MKYKILENSYIYRNEDNDTISLMIKSTDQIIYLNKSAKKILLEDNKSWELSDIIDCWNIDEKNKKEIYKDYEELLYQLECFGIVEIERDNITKDNGCRIAGERDYFNIADFIQKNIYYRFSYSNITNMKYYNSISIRTRQFNNTEYNILYCLNGEIVAVLVIALPPNTSGFSVTYLNAVFFKNSLDEKDCITILKEQISFVDELFRRDFRKIRFHYYDAKQKWLLAQLETLNFKKICTFEKELYSNKNLSIYDKFFEEL